MLTFTVVQIHADTVQINVPFLSSLDRIVHKLVKKTKNKYEAEQRKNGRSFFKNISKFHKKTPKEIILKNKTKRKLAATHRLSSVRTNSRTSKPPVPLG